jgi:hypothetical protein
MRIFYIASTMLLLASLLSAADCGGKVICSCGDTLMESTRLTHDLTEDFGTCLSIGADNVTLNCNGHSISAAMEGAAAIYSSEKDNLEVLNCHIEGFQQGIVLMDGSGARFEGNGIIASGDSSYGVWIFSNSLPAANNNVIGNKIEARSQGGEQEALGVYLSGTGLINNTISGNSIIATAASYSSKALGIWATSNQHFLLNVISKNAIYASSPGEASGVVLHNFGTASNNHIDANAVNVESLCIVGEERGQATPTIYIDGIRLVKFSDGNSIAFNHADSECLGAEGIFVTSALHGISLSSSSVAHNSFSASSKNQKSQGIFLEGHSSSNEVQNNTLSSGDHSVLLGEQTGDNLFFHNRFLARSKQGLYATDLSGGNNQFFRINPFGMRKRNSAEGNLWGDAASLSIFDADADGFGDSGKQYPYSEANGAMVSPGVVDSGPMGVRRIDDRR